MNDDMGWIPLMHRRWIAMLRFWNRILNVNHERLLKRIFEIDYFICNINWCAEIKNIMERLDLDTYFDDKLSISLEIVRQKIYALYASNWSENVITVPKLRTYISFKTVFKTEHYVLINLR